MAIKKPLTISKLGKQLTFGSAYIQISSVAGNKYRQTALVTIYSDEGKEHILQESGFDFIPNMNGENFIKQAYEHAKLLPEYQNGEDC